MIFTYNTLCSVGKALASVDEKLVNFNKAEINKDHSNLLAKTASVAKRNFALLIHTTLHASLYILAKVLYLFGKSTAVQELYLKKFFMRDLEALKDTKLYWFNSKAICLQAALINKDSKVEPLVHRCIIKNLEFSTEDKVNFENMFKKACSQKVKGMNGYSFGIIALNELKQYDKSITYEFSQVLNYTKNCLYTGDQKTDFDPDKKIDGFIRPIILGEIIDGEEWKFKELN